MSSIFNAIYAFWNQIIYAVASMRIPFDIIDILLMAYIIYKAIGFLRETRAGQLAKGLVILFVIYLVANWWNLTTMKWILSRFVDYIIIAVAIIFQPELRRILERVGHTKLVGSHSSSLEGDPLEDCIDKVSRAAGIMQESKTPLTEEGHKYVKKTILDQAGLNRKKNNMLKRLFTLQNIEFKKSK